MNTVGKTVSVMGTIFILFLSGSVGEVVAAEREPSWLPIELVKPKDPREAPAIDILVTKQTGLTLKEQPTQRGQHPKHLGCVHATFEVEVDKVRKDLKHGLFKKSKKYPSLIRFSKGKNNHDGQKDSFGMAIKIFEGDPNLAEKNTSIQDFVLSSNEVFFAPNPFLLLKFKEAERAGKNHFLPYPDPKVFGDFKQPIVNNPNLPKIEQDYQWFREIVRRSHIHPRNLLWQPYWSQTPYSLGTEKKVKYFVRPTTASLACGAKGDFEKTCKRPFFINDLRYFMQKDLDPIDKTKTDVSFDFVIQEWPEGGHSGITEAPIEDPRFPWSTEGTACTGGSFCTKVAKITVSKQTFLSPGKMAFCEQMSFSPWHSLPEHHEPLGGINNARKPVYQLGSKMRHVVTQASSKEPTWSEYEIVKEYDEQLDKGSQGWSREEQGKYHHAPQGTLLIPYPWLLALERMDLFGKKNVPFLDDANIARYGFLPDPSRPDGLPVGFTRSAYIDAKNRHTWVGITCAACHTGQLTYRGKIIRIDGAPSMQRNRHFLTAMAGALKETLERPEKFERFSDQVRWISFRENLPGLKKIFQYIHFLTGKKAVSLADKKGITDKDIKEHFDPLWKNLLRNEVREYMNELIRLKVTETKKNIFPTDWGHGRIDALGRGGNTLLVDLHHDNVEQADAPVSIPKIWDAWKFDWVQWNGSLTQPTARNIAQAIGVRTETVMEESRGLYNKTSVSLKNLVALEQQLEKLRPPSWPEKLGWQFTINLETAKQGKELYKVHCKGCHVPKNIDPFEKPASGKKHDYRVDPYKITFIGTEYIGTDPATANNFKARRVQTGEFKEIFEGRVLKPKDVIEKLTTEVREDLLDAHINDICPTEQESSSMCEEIGSLREKLRESQDKNLMEEPKKQLLNEIAKKSKDLKGQIGGGCETNLLLMDDGVKRKIWDHATGKWRVEDAEERTERLKKKRIYDVCVFLALVEQDKGRHNTVQAHLKYIARPNAGVWATAPFLHNGSVPNLYQLLSPRKDRTEKFCLGKADFDPKYVGFEVSMPPCIPFVESEFDTGKSGNNNSGHEFRNFKKDNKDGYKCNDSKHRPTGVLGCKLKPLERFEIIEYLKTLDCEFLTLDCTVPGSVKIPMPDQVARRDGSESTVAPSTASKIVQHLGIHNENGVKVREAD